MALISHPALEGTIPPAYRAGETRGRYFAHFAEGSAVPVIRSRERWYPKLGSAAPCMLAIYEALAASLTDEKLVWDVGCGTGAGTRILTAPGRTAVGFEVDSDAREYARQFAPTEVFAELPTAADPSAVPDAIVLVDVLGVTARPRHLLAQLRRLAGPRTRLIVVDYRAFCAQTIAPAKRAFSQRSLRALLVQSGWVAEVVDVLAETLVLATAFPGSGPEANLFDGAATACEQGDSRGARALLTQLAAVGSPAVRIQANLELADLCFLLGDGDAAGTALSQVALIDPLDPGANAGMSRLALAMGNPNDALLLALQALDRDTTDARAMVALAHAAEQATPSEATNAWGMACSLMPDDVAILTNRARTCAEAGQPELAIAALEQLRSYHPQQGPDLSTTIAWLLLEAGRHADAQLEMRVAAALGADSAEVEQLEEAIATALAQAASAH